MKKHSYADQPAYKKWVLARDKALEHLHINAQLQSTDEMRRALTQVLLVAKASYHDLKNPFMAHAADQLSKNTHDILRGAGDHLFQIMTLLRIRSYILAKTSETEIIAQLNRAKELKNKVDHTDLIKKRAEESFAGGPLFHRIQLYMDRLARKIVTMAQGSSLNAPDQQSFLIDVLQVFPRRKIYKRPPRVLSPKLMESDEDLPPELRGPFNQASKKIDKAIDYIDENEWQDMVQSYLSDYIPKWRAPEYIVDIPITDPTITATGEEVWYAWEFEQDLTQEFVQSVRDGQIDAANQAGIVDFIWIAVIDSATDACCKWRDGLLISEIESKLSEHEDEDDECNLENDGLNPPIHFRCRCALAPATENIPDRPDLSEDKDFVQWLNS